MTCVYLKKSELENGGCVLAPYKISNGKLQGIEYEMNGEDMLVTDIALGDLVITEDTTVADFSVAVEMMNEDWEDGDQITFFYGTQKVDSQGVPRARIRGWKVKLDVTDETLLWTCVSSLGFSSVGGFLGMGASIENGAAAWVHSREDEQKNLTVSSQRLTVDSSVLESYMGQAAFDASVQSYGGITSRKVFLRPDDETNGVRGGWVTPTGSGGSESGHRRVLAARRAAARVVARRAMVMAAARLAVVTRLAVTMAARRAVVTPVVTPEGTMMVMVWTRTRSRAIEGNGEICSPFFVSGGSPRPQFSTTHPPLSWHLREGTYPSPNLSPHGERLNVELQGRNCLLSVQ